MVNERYAIAMSETLHYLKGINQNDLDIIPNKFIQFLNDNCSMDYKCNFDYTKPLKELDISNEARGLIAMICLNYWCTDEEQKEMFKKHLTENELKYQEELRKQYNSDDIFVIGGESIYRQLLPYCKTAYITKIDHAYQADTFFPDLDQDPQWQMTKISDEQTYFDLEYVFTIYERVS